MMGVGILSTVSLISIIGRHDMRHVALHGESIQGLEDRCLTSPI